MKLLELRVGDDNLSCEIVELNETVEFITKFLELHILHKRSLKYQRKGGFTSMVRTGTAVKAVLGLMSNLKSEPPMP
jgi:hypothetical protein